MEGTQGRVGGDQGGRYGFVDGIVSLRGNNRTGQDRVWICLITIIDGLRKGVTVFWVIREATRY